MNNDSGNPYYKEREFKPLTDETSSFRLSDEIRNDFETYIIHKYPEAYNPKKQKINYSYVFKYLVPEILNSNCTERKSFKITVLATYPKTISTNSSLTCCYIGSRDNYLIERLNEEGNPLEENQLNNVPYLPSSEEVSVEEILRLHQEDFLTDETIIENLLQQDKKYFKDNVHHYIESNVPEEYHEEYIDFSFIRFDVNNYLDEFIDNGFKSSDSEIANSDVHQGLTYFKDEETNLIYYFVYEWLLTNDYEFKLLNINLIDERTFNKLIIDSSNTELHSFLRVLEEDNVEAIETTEETKVEKLEKKVKELREELELEKEYRKGLEESYEELKSNKKRLPLAIESEELIKLGYNEAKIDVKRLFYKTLFENGLKPYLELSDIDEDSSED